MGRRDFALCYITRKKMEIYPDVRCEPAGDRDRSDECYWKGESRVLDVTATSKCREGVSEESAADLKYLLSF